MSDSNTFPLEQMITINKRRFDAAVKTLEEKKKLLEIAYEKLYDASAERDEILQHKISKLEQLRNELDKGTTTDKIQQSMVYLKIVEEKRLVKEKKVVEHQKHVDTAQKHVDTATDALFQKKKDLEKLEMYKKEWIKERGEWVRAKEATEHDEQGSATHFLRQDERKKRKKDQEKKNLS